MKLLANENIPVNTIHKLKQIGLDIISIGEEYTSITDEEVIHLAIEHGRTILTFDRDYGELIYKKGFRPKSGVIYLRVQQYTPEYLAEFLNEIFQNTEIHFENCFTVINERKIRQRKY